MPTERRRPRLRVLVLAGMVVGSLMPQLLANRHEHVSHHLQPHG